MEKLAEITTELFEAAGPTELKSDLTYLLLQYLMLKEVDPRKDMIENFYFLFDFLEKAERLKAP
jgi:hypothetical protein